MKPFGETSNLCLLWPCFSILSHPPPPSPSNLTLPVPTPFCLFPHSISSSPFLLPSSISVLLFVYFDLLLLLSTTFHNKPPLTSVAPYPSDTMAQKQDSMNFRTALLVDAPPVTRIEARLPRIPLNRFMTSDLIAFTSGSHCWSSRSARSASDWTDTWRWRPIASWRCSGGGAATWRSRPFFIASSSCDGSSSDVDFVSFDFLSSSPRFSNTLSSSSGELLSFPDALDVGLRSVLCPSSFSVLFPGLCGRQEHLLLVLVEEKSPKSRCAGHHCGRHVTHILKHLTEGRENEKKSWREEAKKKTVQ